jgi:hypothetical protein
LKTVAIKVTRPHELIDAGIIVVILVIGPLARAIDVFVSDSIVIVI